MNRLTKRAKNGLAYSDIPLNQSSVLDANENIVECYTGFIADRLAEFEDKGFEPEEVRGFANVGMTPKQINELIKILKNPTFEDDYDMLLEATENAMKDLYKYYDLEEQGLLIKLHYAIGDTVYYLEDYGTWLDNKVYMPIKCKVSSMFIDFENKFYYYLDSIDELISIDSSYDEIPENEIYKTREEAEKALEANNE